MKSFTLLIMSAALLMISGCTSENISQENSKITPVVTTETPIQQEVVVTPPVTLELREEKTKDAITPAKGELWPEFKGAFFKVIFPPNFTALGDEFYLGSQEIFDSAFFTSPDKTVSFYVYSPLWSSIPNYVNPQKNETLVTEKTDVIKKYDDGSEATEVTYRTIRANDGSYTRSLYAERKGAVDEFARESKVFEIKYATQAAYDMYKDQYLKFKASLVQYSD